MDSVYLSRLRLNPLSNEVLKLTQNPYGVHQLLQGLFGQTREQSGTLFRIDDEPYGPVLLFQSYIEPNFHNLKLAPNSLLHPGETKEFEFKPVVGARYAFRLLTRPSKRSPQAESGLRKNGKPRIGLRQDIKEEEGQRKWLISQGEKHGFGLESASLTWVSWNDSNPKTPKHGSLGAVRFDGTLVCIDASALQKAVYQGVGHQRAYGFGLLSLRIL